MGEMGCGFIGEVGGGIFFWLDVDLGLLVGFCGGFEVIKGEIGLLF